MVGPEPLFGGSGSMAGHHLRVHGTDRVVELPHPAVTIVFQLGDPMTIGAGPGATRGRAVVVGVCGRPTVTESSGVVDCVELRLSPTSAFSLFGGMPMTELTAGPVDLDAVAGGRVGEVVERAATASTWPDRFDEVRSLLVALGDEGRDGGGGAAHAEPDAGVERAWALLARSGGTIPVNELCAATGWSPGRLRRRFQAQVGLTPKRAGRLIRFDRARRLLEAGMTPAETAAACGFFDQSHLHRDVGEFAGLTPSEVARRP